MNSKPKAVGTVAWIIMAPLMVASASQSFRCPTHMTALRISAARWQPDAAKTQQKGGDLRRKAANRTLVGLGQLQYDIRTAVTNKR